MASGYADLENVSKAALLRIDISELPQDIPDFQRAWRNQGHLVAEWLKTGLWTRLKTAG